MQELKDENAQLFEIAGGLQKERDEAKERAAALEKDKEKLMYYCVTL